MMDFAIGGLAAAGAGFFSNPLDVLKTRMQLQGELQARGQHAVHYKNVFHAAVVVVKNDGIAGLQKGVGPAVLMHFIRNSVRLGLYQCFVDSGLIKDSSGNTILYKSFLASSLSGAAGAFFGSPLFLIKTQLQSQSACSIAVGYQHRHRGTMEALRDIFKKYGLRGLWRGTGATMLRAIAGSSSQLTTFAMTKDYLRKRTFFKNSPVYTTFIASIIGGIFQTFAITPFDLVSTRLYNQGVNKNGQGLLYKGIIDCFIKVWKTEGAWGFYKGVGANYMRLAPHGVLTLVFWDSLKEAKRRYIAHKKTKTVKLEAYNKINQS